MRGHDCTQVVDRTTTNDVLTRYQMTALWLEKGKCLLLLLHLCQMVLLLIKNALRL